MFDFITPFYLHYYNSHAWMDTYWMGHPVYKCPLDLFLYQEILFSVKPDVIVECGTNQGGSALYLAHMCDLMNKGRIVTVDIVEVERPKHDRITYLTGDSASVDTLNRVKPFINPEDVVLVILDSDHTEQHVYKELMLYHQLVTVGSYIIVEDTIVGHPVNPELLPGPMEAVGRFLPDHGEFIIDMNKHKFHLTFNPNGYLLRVK
ncbi:CmcI family methyltransferase [Paenibacillus sp. UMB4589-SE434]|uniref:CmcI family methyltransferase n=1 Tax=Paenibacillus sp. UMB4589-SE434 TaxID=3046314 RepID=UPI0025513D65|nr:CmcI family methyltransferase [Paenibacillus sp. UMB4589-SE434]MDK8181816.1 CmcI family methyltransferase [Paenibacillus sp. UMB4589-SE434]